MKKGHFAGVLSLSLFNVVPERVLPPHLRLLGHLHHYLEQCLLLPFRALGFDESRCGAFQVPKTLSVSKIPDADIRDDTYMVERCPVPTPIHRI